MGRKRLSAQGRVPMALSTSGFEEVNTEEYGQGMSKSRMKRVRASQDNIYSSAGARSTTWVDSRAILKDAMLSDHQG